MKIKKHLITLFEDWLKWVAIFVAMLGIFYPLYLFINVMMQHQVDAKIFEKIGIIWGLTSSVWTALGSHLNKTEIRELEKKSDSGILDGKEIVKIFKTASFFSTFGVVVIIMSAFSLLYSLIYK